MPVDAFPKLSIKKESLIFFFLEVHRLPTKKMTVSMYVCIMYFMNEVSGKDNIS